MSGGSPAAARRPSLPLRPGASANGGYRRSSRSCSCVTSAPSIVGAGWPFRCDPFHAHVRALRVLAVAASVGSPGVLGSSRRPVSRWVWPSPLATRPRRGAHASPRGRRRRQRKRKRTGRALEPRSDRRQHAPTPEKRRPTDLRSRLTTKSARPLERTAARAHVRATGGDLSRAGAFRAPHPPASPGDANRSAGVSNSGRSASIPPATPRPATPTSDRRPSSRTSLSDARRGGRGNGGSDVAAGSDRTPASPAQRPCDYAASRV